MTAADATRAEAARVQGRARLAKWGALVVDKKRVRALVNSTSMSIFDLYDLNNAIGATDRKIVSIGAQAERAEGGVDWPDAHVEHAVRTLTALDDDRGEYANGVGWNPRISSKGHWCNAMLDENRELALRLARTLVGNYREQLQRPEIRHAYPLPAGWEITK